MAALMATFRLDERRQLFAIEVLQHLEHLRVADNRVLHDFREALSPFALR